MRVLLVKEDPASADMIAFFLESRFNFEVERVSNSQEAMDRLLEDAEIDLMICEDSDKNLKIFKYLLSTSSEIPTVLIKNPGATDVLAFPDVVIGSADASKVNDELGTIIQNGIQSGRFSRGSAQSDFCRIRTALLTRVVPLKSDIYVRLSSVKYVKMFKQGDVFDRQDMENFLKKKKIDYLYLRKEDSAEFIVKFNLDLTSLANSEKTTPETAGNLAASVHEALQELGNSLGFTPAVQEMAKQGVKLTLKSIGTSPRLAKFLAILGKDKDKYITVHSLSLAQVACSLAAATDWFSETTFQKLSFAAFFHDIVVVNQKIAQLGTLEEIEQYKHQFSDAEVATYKNHPYLGAELVRRLSEIPSDVDTIIFQHHERPDGSGFPRGITASYIAPLACVFIIAHDFVDWVYHEKGHSVEEFLNLAKERYTSGNFRKVIESLLKNKARLMT